MLSHCVQVALHRSDALTTVIDLDHDLNVARADDSAGLMFGVNARQLHHMNFARWDSAVNLAPLPYLYACTLPGPGIQNSKPCGRTCHGLRMPQPTSNCAGDNLSALLQVGGSA